MAEVAYQRELTEGAVRHFTNNVESFILLAQLRFNVETSVEDPSVVGGIVSQDVEALEPGPQLRGAQVEDNGDIIANAHR